MAIEVSEKIRFYGKEALEDRLNVGSIEERNAIPLNERYNGMITTVREEGKRYELLYKGDFEALSEGEKNSFLGDDNNWEEASAGYAFTDKDKAINIEDLEIEDWNDVIDSGLYMGSNKANAPTASDIVHAWRYVQTIKHNEDYGIQIAWDFAGVAMWVRTRNSGYWNEWKRIVVQGNIMTITTEGWQKGKPLIYKAIVDDDIGIQEWEMARIYATPHNDGYYDKEVSPMSYVALKHRFLKDDTDGAEEKGVIEAGKLEVEEIRGGNNLEIKNNKPVKLLFKDPRHSDSAFLGPGQQLLLGNLIAGKGSNFSEYGYDESGFPIKLPSPLRHPIVGSGTNGNIYAEEGVASLVMEAQMFCVSTRDGGQSQIVFRDEDEDSSWPTAVIEADANSIDGEGRRSLKYKANKHIFQKEGTSEPVPGEIETGKVVATGLVNVFGKWSFAVDDFIKDGKRVIVCLSNNRLDLNYGKDFTAGTHVHGSLTATENITAYSDKRLKENIKPIANALDKIKRIQGVSYTRNDEKDTKKQHIGVIAQDLLEVVPEVVNVPEKQEDMHSVDYSKLTALLIEGIKEQQKEIEMLKQEIMALKGGSNGTS